MLKALHGSMLGIEKLCSLLENMCSPTYQQESSQLQAVSGSGEIA